jgi:hypothetical protein
LGQIAPRIEKEAREEEGWRDGVGEETARGEERKPRRTQFI